MKKRPKKSAAFPDQGPWLEDDLVVWRMRKNLPCAMCKRPLKKQRRDLAAMQQTGKLWIPTCLKCLHVDHLVFLPAGDSRVTRTASRLSSRRAVVMASRRKFLQREGILVERAAMHEACAKYDVPLPPELQDAAPIMAAPPPSETKLFQPPEPPRPTPQRATKRDATRNYRFFDAPAAEKSSPTTMQPATTQPATTKPATTRPAAAQPAHATAANPAYIKTLADRIRARYPRSPDKMIDEITLYALHVYLPKLTENNPLPPAADIDLGPLLTAFLRR